MLLDNETHTLGIFWFPDYPDNKFQGELSIAKTGKIKLKLIEYFPSENSFSLLKEENNKALYGITEKYGKIFCESLNKTNETLFPNLKTTYDIDRVITNIPVFPPDLITKLRFSTVRLNEWLNSPITAKAEPVLLAELNHFSIYYGKNKSLEESLNHSNTTISVYRNTFFRKD